MAQTQMQSTKKDMTLLAHFQQQTGLQKNVRLNLICPDMSTKHF